MTHGTVFDFAAAAARRSDVLGETSDRADRAVARQAAAIHRVARGAGPARRFLAGDGRCAAFHAGNAGVDGNRPARPAIAALCDAHRSRPGCDNCARLDFARQACRTARLGCSPLRTTMPVLWALCLGLRHEHRVMQPLWSKLRTSALATQPRDRFVGGIAAARSRRRLETEHTPVDLFSPPL
jgi:hypothetical protein